MTVGVLWPFGTMAWAGLQCLSVVFPGHIHLLFDCSCKLSAAYRIFFNEIEAFYIPNKVLFIGI